MRLLITGARGMVGRNLTAHHGAADYDLLTPGSAELDLRDPIATMAYLRTHRPDGIIHMAAVVGGIQANIDEPVRFLTANTEMALTLFTAARQLGISRILNVASSCMYPRNVQGTLTTDLLLSAPLEPTNEGYALSKIFSWKLLEYMNREDPTLIYRTILPCNLYGLYDHFDPRKSHLVPAAIMKVVTAHECGLGTVEIWGDGTARREFMFAADLADFIWWAMGRLETLPSPLNVGLGQDWSVREYYEAIAELVGYRRQFVYDPAKPAGMARKLLDVTELHGLGWTAPTALRDGLSQTIAYYREARR
jgi:nucleoside-diphosphate-sugar epimerase